MRTRKLILPRLLPLDSSGSSNFFFEFVESFSELIFCHGYIPGLLFVILCAFCNLNLAGAALVAAVTLFLAIKIAGVNWSKHRAAYMIYNPILVGMSIGVIFRLDLSVILIISIVTVLTLVLTVSMSEFFKPMGIPLLSLPFAIISTAFYLASTHYNRLFTLAFYNNNLFAEYETYLPDVIAAFLKAFGTIIFMPNILVGGVIFLTILFHSRILAIHAIAAFFAGVSIHSLLTSSFDQSLNNPYNFNYILVGLALGGVFLLPSLRSSLICLIAVGVSVILVDVTGGFAELFHIPVFTLPFNFSVILFVYALRAIAYSDINNDIRLTPEDSLLASRVVRSRFRPQEPSIGLPMNVPLSIYQAQEDEWTHKNEWRYAFDFVIRDDDGNMGAHDESLENNYIFGKEIISPVTGYVVSCCDAFIDNAIGTVDHCNNWGNFLIIQTAHGWFVEISHLMQNSLLVRNGEYVELGQVVAKCGNSGFSPVPHIHMQVQKTGLLGDETIPFNLAIYRKEHQIYYLAKPKRNDKVEPLDYNTEMAISLNLNLATVHKYTLFEGKEKIDTLTFCVRRDATTSANLYLQDQTGARLYFAYAKGTFYFHDFVGSNASLLKMLYTAMPRLPLVNLPGFTWDDCLPPNLIGNWFDRVLFPLKAWFCPTLSCNMGTWTFDRGRITGKVTADNKTISTSLMLHPVLGIEKVQVDNMILRRTD